MPWNEVTKMELKQEFVLHAMKEGSNISELCRRFGISRKTGYKLISRFKEQGSKGLEEQKRAHLKHPFATPLEMEKLIIEERARHPSWGARKLKRVLENQGIENVPAKSSVNRVLDRHGLLRKQEEIRTKEWHFFEHEQPNDLWQMDFKGHFEIADGRCHPLTVLDDHSRYSIVLNAYGNERGSTVKEGLIEAFRRYGMPIRMNVDNGPPWGTSHGSGCTSLVYWLMRMGIQVTHSAPFHPQTNGKDERFHRTLKAEVLSGRYYKSLSQTQKVFDEWRQIYNTKRPHEALNMEVPISRYMPSKRSYSEQPPSIEYDARDIVKRVNSSGYIDFKGNKYYISEGLVKEDVALRPTVVDGEYEVFYCAQKIKLIDPGMGV